jgi:putative transposase
MSKAFNADDIPADRSSVTIPLLPDAHPVYKQQFPIPDAHREFLHSEVQRLVSEHKIRPVDPPSAWNTPVFVVQDKVVDGKPKLRVVQDFRPLNEVCAEVGYPLPNLHEALHRAAHHSVFTALDLSSGFHQLKLDPASVPLTRFTVNDQVYEWLVLPMGVACAPSFFHSFLHGLLSDIPGVLVYVDDVLIMADSISQHDAILAQVMDTLTTAGLFVNPAKTQLCKTKVEYLGHMISHNAIGPLPRYMQTLSSSDKPTTCKEIRRLLGAANWVASFLPHLREVMQPFQVWSGRKGRF